MKIRSLLVIAFLAVSISASAQARFGIKAGLNVSEISGYELESKAGFHAGVMMQYMFNEHAGFESGLYYSLIGGSEREVDYDEDFERTANPSYLQLPIMFLYKFGAADDLTIYPAVGVYLGYGIAGDIESSGNILGRDISGKVDFFNDDRNNFDMGVSFGANLQYKSFIFGLGYEQGFLKINKNNIPFEEDDAFNSNFKVSVGFLF